MPPTIEPIEASIHIDAPPARVWGIVSDQRRMNEFSPETFRQKFFGQEIGLGTRSINLNKRKGFFWPTASLITEFVPEQRLAFYVYLAGTIWSYDLEPSDGGTTVTERREVKRGRRTVLARLTASLALGGVDEHDVELIAGMKTTLARIKAEAEGF
jgi:uncharacterized protein YndB with AHSA1/START domain